MKNQVKINVNILPWAINRAGYDFQEFIQKFSNVQQWFENEKTPTVKQLEEFSKKVHLPFGFLFLTEPPEEKLPIPFFRSKGNQTSQISINVYDTILMMQQRQNWLSSYLLENGFEPLNYVGKFKNSQNVKAIVTDILQTLQLEKNWTSQIKTWQDAKDRLVENIEDKGIITVFNSVVENNTHRPISVEECRGFVLVDEYAPFMFINNADSKSAQMFTIVHELAHIWTGHSAGFDFRKLQPADDPVEKLCDRVAAEFLVPEEVFDKVWNNKKDFSNASRYFKVSEIVIARRALDTGKISITEFFEFYDDFCNKEFRKKDNQNSSGDFYKTTRKRIGITFASYVNQAVKSGQLLYRDACKLTGLKGDTFEKFFSKFFR